MKIIICGGRHFDNYDYLSFLLHDFLGRARLDYSNIEIVSGHCTGADLLGEQFAKEHGIKLTVFPAEWSKYGRSAGPIRNKQMIDYIKTDSHPLVIAFTSPRTRGTRNTITLAEKEHIPVLESEYDTLDEDIILREGITKDINGYSFDWEADSREDLVHLTGTKIHTTRFNKNIRYFGYKIQHTTDNSTDVKDFMSYIKTSRGYQNPQVQEMIDKCLENFYEQCSAEHFDLVIQTKSSSDIVKILSEEIAEKFDDIPILELSKKPVKALELDTAKLRKELKGDDTYFQKLASFINIRYIDPQKRKGYFSIAQISPKYRRYIKPMYIIENTLQDLNNYKNILVVDEAITTGETFTMIVDLLRNEGYQGNISLFSLLSNR